MTETSSSSAGLSIFMTIGFVFFSFLMIGAGIVEGFKVYWPGIAFTLSLI